MLQMSLVRDANALGSIKVEVSINRSEVNLGLSFLGPESPIL